MAGVELPSVPNVDLNFTPSKQELYDDISTDAKSFQQTNIRLFSFDDDDIDNSLEFVSAYSQRGIKGTTITTQSLNGNHLTPVYLDLSMVPGAGEIIGGGTGGFKFGDLNDVEQLIDSVADWCLGKGPTTNEIDVAFIESSDNIE